MYYIVFVIGGFLAMINDKKKISFKLFVLILALLAFFRYGVGSDYFAYNFLYTRLNESLISEVKYGLDNQEILFRMIGSIFKKIGLSYQQYIIIIATINIYYISKICKKYSKNASLSLFTYLCFYYFVWTFSGLRQGLTLVIGIYYLLDCLENKKTIKLVLISIVLSFIHISSLILIPLYMSTKIKFNKKRLIVLSLISLFIAILPLANVLQKLAWLPFLNRLLPYLNDNASILNIFDFQSIARIIFLFIALFYYDSYIKQDDISKKIITIYIISLITYFFLKFSETTAARLAIYGMFLNILILPNIYYIYKNKLDKYIYITFLGILCVLYFNKELSTMQKQAGLVNTNNLLIPYTNIYNKDSYTFTERYFFYLN